MSTSIPSVGTTSVATPVPSNNSVVIPQITFPNPFNSYSQPAPSLQGPQLSRVKNMDGAKQFPTVANAMYALFEEEDDVFYVKVTDKNNYPVSLKRFRFYEEEEPAPPTPAELVTKEEYTALQNDYKKLHEEVMNLRNDIQNMKEANTNAKQFVRNKPNNDADRIILSGSNNNGNTAK